MDCYIDLMKSAVATYTRVCTPDDHDQYVKAVQVLRTDQRAQVMFQ